VKALVDLEKGRAVLHRLLQLAVQTLQLLNVLRPRELGHMRRCVRFQEGQKVVHIVQIFVADISDVSTAAHLHGHQAFGGQHFERLTQRRAADAVLL